MIDEAPESRLEKVNIVLSLVFLLLLGVYCFLLFNYRPLMGDDFSLYYYKDVSGYIDKAQADTLEYQSRIGLTFSAYVEIMVGKYQTISGRVISSALGCIYSALNCRTLFAVVGALVYAAVLLLAGRLVFHKVREVLRHPLILVLMGSGLWLYNGGVGNLYMFTMLFHYGVTYLLWLVMLNFSLDRIWMAEEKPSGKDWKKLAAVNLLGIFAGLTHEMIGAFSLLMIAAMTLAAKGMKNSLRELKYYVGAFCGYLICFFAPGNFNRASSEHDASINDPYVTKLIASGKQHLQTFLDMEELGKWLWIGGFFLLGLGVFLKIRRREKIAWKKVLFWQLSVVVSILLWATVSYVPKYGILLAMICEMVALLRLLYDPSEDARQKEPRTCWYGTQTSAMVLAEEPQAPSGVLAAVSRSTIGQHLRAGKAKRMAMPVITAFVIGLIASNLCWVPQMIKETKQRDELVSEAAATGQEQVVVPSYSETVVSHIVMVPNNLNNSKYYRGKKVTPIYYGTQIIIGD